MSTIYNATDGPLIIDRAGRVLGGREHREDVETETVPRFARHVAAGRLVVTDTPATDTVADEVAVEDAPVKASTPRTPRPTKEA